MYHCDISIPLVSSRSEVWLLAMSTSALTEPIHRSDVVPPSLSGCANTALRPLPSSATLSHVLRSPCLILFGLFRQQPLYGPCPSTTSRLSSSHNSPLSSLSHPPCRSRTWT